MSVLGRTSAVAIGGRALLIQGEPGSGKSSLALALIDRGAVLIGDDGVTLAVHGGRLLASPPPNTAGLLEVRNLGLLSWPTAAGVPVALVLRFDPEAPRFIEAADRLELGGLPVPLVRIWPDGPVPAIKAELALQRFGLTPN